MNARLAALTAAAKAEDMPAWNSRLTHTEANTHATTTCSNRGCTTTVGCVGGREPEQTGGKSLQVVNCLLGRAEERALHCQGQACGLLRQAWGLAQLL